MTNTLPIEAHQAFSAKASRARTTVELAADRLSAAKIAFTCRRVPTDEMQTLVETAAPQPGDLVLARVERRRQHPRIELVTGRKASLFIGDEIVVCYGNRYATDQFEAVVPEELGPCHLVASGGIAGTVLSRMRGVRPPTEITPLGLVADSKGRVLNLADYALAEAKDQRPQQLPTCIAVAGSSMNAGKTTTAAQLVRGLQLAGHRVGAAKVTGTGSGGDYWKLLDAGAAEVVDFTDAGFASTFQEPLHQLERIVVDLTAHLARKGADVIVLEIADGILQSETAALLNSDTMRERVTGYLLAVSDPLGAVAGAKWMQERNLPLLGLCGTLTRSLLAVREAVDATGLPILSLKELRTPEVVELLAQEHAAAQRPAAHRAL